MHFCMVMYRCRVYIAALKQPWYREAKIREIESRVVVHLCVVCKAVQSIYVVNKIHPQPPDAHLEQTRLANGNLPRIHLWP